MRAVVLDEYGGPDAFRLKQLPDPVPGADELLVDIKACGLNRADTLQRAGKYPGPTQPPPGQIFGMEMAGVVARGAGEFKPGDRVFGHLQNGGYAERVLIHRSLAMRIPPNLSFEEAAAIPVNWLVAYDALVNRAEVKRGQAVLIHAVGSGVGIAALQIAREKGCTVFGTAGSAEKLGKAAELGLHVGINYRSEDFAAVVHERTDGAGVHAILDMVGGSYYTANVASLRYLGRLVFLGNMGGAKFEGDVMPFLNKRLSAIGSHLRSRALDERSALTAQLRDDILPLFESGKLRSIVDRAFPIEKVGDAHRYLESQANFGKVVITLS